MTVFLTIAVLFVAYYVVRQVVIPFYARSARDAGLISSATARQISDGSREILSAGAMEHEARGAVDERRRVELLEMAEAKYRDTGDAAAAERLGAYLRARRALDHGNVDEAARALEPIAGRSDELVMALEGRLRIHLHVSELGGIDGAAGIRAWFEELVSTRLGDRPLLSLEAAKRREMLGRVHAASEADVLRLVTTFLSDAGSVADVESAIDEARQRRGLIPTRSEIVRDWTTRQDAEALVVKVRTACDAWRELELPFELAAGGDARHRLMASVSDPDPGAALAAATEYLMRVPTSHALVRTLELLDQAASPGSASRSGEGGKHFPRA